MSIDATLLNYYSYYQYIIYLNFDIALVLIVQIQSPLSKVALGWYLFSRDIYIISLPKAAKSGHSKPNLFRLTISSSSFLFNILEEQLMFNHQILPYSNQINLQTGIITETNDQIFWQSMLFYDDLIALQLTIPYYCKKSVTFNWKATHLGPFELSEMRRN